VPHPPIENTVKQEIGWIFILKKTKTKAPKQSDQIALKNKM